MFSQEAVREFQVVTNSYSAEFGKASGGVVNIITKSGTNTPSGNAFFFFRDSALNSKSYFERFTPAGDPITRDKAPYGQEQFGATFGGPIQKDRTFIFGSYERLDIDASNFVVIDDTTPVLLFGQPIGTAAGILRAAGFPVETGDVPYAVQSNQLLVKVDRHLTANHQGSLRYNYADALNENIEPWGGLVARSRGAVRDSVDNMLAASHMAVLSSKIVNELRVQFARRDQTVDSLDPNCNGPCVGEDQGGPTLEILGVASVGRNRFVPQPRLNDRYQVLETFSFFRGKHQWKAGLEYNYVNHKVQALPLHFGGRYLFQPLPAIPGLVQAPITGIQALALGLPAAYIQGYGNSSATYGYSDLSLFAQDDWRLSDNLTVKLGVRYQNQFWPSRLYNTPGVQDTYAVPPDNNNIAPRVAVSWRPAGSAKTSLRGSYGIYYDNLVTGAPGIAYIINGAEGVRTLVSRFPASIAAWNAPGHKLPEPAGGTVPSLGDLPRPGAENVIRASLFGWSRSRAAAPHPHVGQLRGRPRFQSARDDRLQPARRRARRRTTAARCRGPGGHVRIRSSGTRRSARLVRRPDAVGRKTAGPSLSISRELYALEGGRHIHGFSECLHSGKTMDSDGIHRTPTACQIGFDPDSERGPSLQDQRHHLVPERHLYRPLRRECVRYHRRGIGKAIQCYRGRRPQR